MASLVPSQLGHPGGWGSSSLPREHGAADSGLLSSCTCALLLPPSPSCLCTASSLGPPALTRCLPRTHRLCPSRYGAHTHWGPCLPLSLRLLPSPSVCFCFGGGMEIVGPRGCVRWARQGQADTPVRRPTSSRSVCVSIAGAVQHGEPINQPGIGSHWLFRRVWIFRG